MELFNDFLLQLGAVGLLLFLLIWFARDAFREQKTQSQKIIDENARLQEEFREYLKQQNADQQKVIDQNTQVFQRLVGFFEGGFLEYLEKRANSQKKLNDALMELVYELKKQNKQ